MHNIINQLSNWIFILFIVGIPVYAAFKKIDVFNSFVTGARQSFDTSINIIPYLIAMMMAIGMLRASGFFDIIFSYMGSLFQYLGVPEKLVPLALIRPFSGSASTALVADILHEEGGNSIISKMAATMMGSTETTFYIIAIYFGSVGIKKTRYAIPAGLIADFVGFISSILFCKILFT